MQSAAGRADVTRACMFTLQHVDCVGIGMHMVFEAQSFCRVRRVA